MRVRFLRNARVYRLYIHGKEKQLEAVPLSCLLLSARSPEGKTRLKKLPGLNNCTSRAVISRTEYRLDLLLFVLFHPYFQLLNDLLKSCCSAGSSGVEGDSFLLNLSKLRVNF